jgi:hypothetical protein
VIFSILSVLLVVTFLVAIGILYYSVNQAQAVISSELEKSLSVLDESLNELRDAIANEQDKSGSFSIDVEEETAQQLAPEERKPKTIRLDDGLEYEIVGGL